jgi:hypothetical protein
MWASGSVFNISLGLSGVFTGLTISLMTKAINRRNTKDIMSIMNRFGTAAEAKRVTTPELFL